MEVDDQHVVPIVGDFLGSVAVMDVPVVPGRTERSLKRAQQLHSRLFGAGMIPVKLGGDCSTNIAGHKSIAEHFDNPRLIHIDSHADTGEDFEGERYNHATAVARAVDEAGFEPENISLIGMNGTLQPEDWIDYVKEHEINLFPLGQIVERSPQAVARDATAVVNDGTDAVFLHIDIDVLDGAHIPGLAFRRQTA